MQEWWFNQPEDIEGDDLLRMMHFQEQLEKDTWQQGNMRQTAPAQRMSDFVNRRLSYDLPTSSYAPGLISSPLHFWLPDNITSRLQQAFKNFGKQAHGFLTNEAVMIATETRTSSPVRILRDREPSCTCVFKVYFLVEKVLDMQVESSVRASMENVVPKWQVLIYRDFNSKIVY